MSAIRGDREKLVLFMVVPTPKIKTFSILAWITNPPATTLPAGAAQMVAFDAL